MPSSSRHDSAAPSPGGRQRSDTQWWELMKSAGSETKPAGRQGPCHVPATANVLKTHSFSSLLNHYSNYYLLLGLFIGSNKIVCVCHYIYNWLFSNV